MRIAPGAARVQESAIAPVATLWPDLKQAVILNIAILFLFIAASYSAPMAYAGGLFLLLYLSLLAMVAPYRTLLLMFGIKLTFDSLWFVVLPEGSHLNIKLTELFIIPFVVLLIRSIASNRISHKHFIVLSSLFVLWIISAMFLNEQDIDYALLVRLSGSLFGLLLGLTVIRKRESFDHIILLIFVSTIIPILAVLFQVVTNYAGITVLFYSLDSTRNIRFAGLYFDTGTMGLVSIISLITASYVIVNDRLGRRANLMLTGFSMITFLSIIVGGTRSILITASCILLALFFVKFRKFRSFIPVIFLLVIIGKPYIDKVTDKSVDEIKGSVQFSRLLQDAEYREMLTGRVSIWQDIWDQFNDGSMLQILFGSGLYSNAHSTYFFLLLYIGWLGLLYYLFLNLLLFRAVTKIRQDKFLKYTALFCIMAFFLIGFSLTAVNYTSFQWIVYLIIGSALNISANLQQPAFGRYHVPQQRV